jgi:toxin YoeB
MKAVWFEEAWEDYLYWQTQEKKLKRINQLLQDISRNGYMDIGKPEPLKDEFGGLWSRRIDEVNRIQNDRVEIVSCKGHYRD